MRNISKFPWRINERIYSPKLRVLAEDGKQIGVLSRDEALIKSKELGLDLIEIAPKANPPVAKVIELGKFRYQEEKKLKKQQKASKASELKEVRFSPFIAENDFNVRLEKVKEFLAQKDKVKLVVVFKGRQLGSRDFGYKLLNKIVNELKDGISVDMEPKFLGRHLVMIISPRFSKKITETSRK